MRYCWRVFEKTCRIGQAAGLLAILLAATGPRPSLATQQPEPEISTKEKETEFTIRARTNEVPVLVVVRDARGKEVGGLTKEDFRLFDNGKPQVIREFSVQLAHPNPAARADQKSSLPVGEKPPEEARAATVPERFAALYFDDTFMSFEDVARTRDAARHYLESSVTLTDRVGLYTSSGLGNVEFTSDRARLEDALDKLRPHPTGSNQTSDCPNITQYEAYLIFVREDPQALDLGASKVILCMCGGNPQQPQAPGGVTINPCAFDPQGRARSMAQQIWTRAQLAEVQTLRGLEELVRRLGGMPGQRSIVWISPGFLAMDQSYEVSSVVDSALRARVVINALDSRGLWTFIPGGDASQKSSLAGGLGMLEVQFAQTAQGVQGDVMAAAASGTGGVFVHDTNDLDGGLRKAGALPEVAYLLSFSPPGLNFDGKYHSLKVELANGRALSLQARKGYFAPQQAPDSEGQAENDIDNAVFARDERNDLGLEIRTQFFMSTPTEADLSVLARVDLHGVQLRKEQRRNVGALRFITVLFDQDGNFVRGQERAVELHLADPTLKKLLAAGFGARSHFKVKPGTYAIREVVQDGSSGNIAALNGSVEIPEPK